MPGPHDLFARYTFGHPERAAAELRAVLPAQLVSEVDWASLRQESGSVVDPELRESESDLLFTARLRTGRSLLLYVLLEHQSRVDRWMALRMLRYVVRLMERWRTEHPESTRLPIILPLVMYHGPEGAWTALFAQVQTDPEGTEHLLVVTRYLLWVGDRAVHKAARQVLHSVMHEERAEALMRSYGEELIEQGLQQGLAKGLAKGREQGLAEGRLRGRAEGVLRILTARGVHTDEAARQRILSCTDESTLDRWFDRALNATALSEVLDDLAQ